MDYRDNIDVTKLNKYNWGNNLIIKEALGIEKEIEGLIIQKIDRQAIPSISRNTVKVPGLNGVRITGRPSLGSTEINVECVKFARDRKEALLYRDELLKMFYMNSEGDAVEVIFPDTGKSEKVWLLDIETISVSREGIISFNLKFENPTGFSHTTIATVVSSGENSKLYTVEPISPRITIFGVDNINNDIKIYIKKDGVFRLAIVLPALNTIEYSNGNKIDANSLSSIAIDAADQSALYEDKGMNKYDITAEVLRHSNHLLDFNELKVTDNICLKTENVTGKITIRYTEYTL